MTHHFEEGTGFFVRKPSWHRLERAVLDEHVTTWTEARDAAGMSWEVVTTPVHVTHPSRTVREMTDDGEVERPLVVDAEEYQAIWRTDSNALLAIQPRTYQLISMAETGDVISAVLGESDVAYEALFALYGGRQIWSLLYFEEPLRIPADPSQTFTYMGICNRFDGQGGLRVLPTNVRIQCANTVNHAELTDGKRVGMTLRHTKNWEQRLDEVAAAIADARRTGEEWAELAQRLAEVKVTPRQTDRFVNAFLPKRDDMTERQEENVASAREQVRQILAGPTCEHIEATAYGLAQAGIEYADHYRRIVSTTGYVGRQIGGKEGLKARALRTARGVAGITR